MRSRKYGRVTVEDHRPSMDFDPDEPCIVFRAQDKLAIQVLAHYAGRCRDTGALVTAEMILAALEDVIDWQAAHPDRVKLPD